MSWPNPNPLDMPAGAWLQVVMGSAHSTRIHSVRSDRRHKSTYPHISTYPHSLWDPQRSQCVSLESHLCWPCPFPWRGSMSVRCSVSVSNWFSDQQDGRVVWVYPQFAGLHYIIAFCIFKSTADHGNSSVGDQEWHPCTENIIKHILNRIGKWIIHIS